MCVPSAKTLQPVLEVSGSRAGGADKAAFAALCRRQTLDRWKTPNDIPDIALSAAPRRCGRKIIAFYYNR